MTGTEKDEMTMRTMPPALLERWMREFYFDVDVDIGSSGVEDFSLAEIRQITGLPTEALDRIVFHDSQTLGQPSLREALAAHLGVADPTCVMPTHGSSEAIFLVMHALLEPGDEVVALDPIYPQLVAFAEHFGCRIRRWRLRFEDGFRPDLDEGRRLIGPRTRLVVVNFPHNPTGVTLEPEEQEALVAAAAEVGAHLVWDGAFTRLVYEGRTPLPEPIALDERALSLGTLSKAYGLPGLRVGWVVGAPETLRKFAHVRDYTLLHLSPLVETIAAAVFEHGDALVERRRRRAAENRERLRAWIESQEGRVRWVPPAGGASCFPRLERVADVDALCRRLATEHRVLLVPGSCFGAPRHVRLGFGGAPESLAQGLSCLNEELQVAESAA